MRIGEKMETLQYLSKMDNLIAQIKPLNAAIGLVAKKRLPRQYVHMIGSNVTGSGVRLVGVLDMKRVPIAFICTFGAGCFIHTIGRQAEIVELAFRDHIVMLTMTVLPHAS
jgi:hypothetical protein